MEWIGGYRIVRKLGAGSRADVFLGHTDQESAGRRQVAIKVFHAGTSPSSIDGEIAALSRLRHPHLLRLLDLASGPSGSPCLILPRLERGGLAELLANRASLDGGEAVTVLAPLVGAVSVMFRAGVAHGRLNARSVLFDADGAPVLTGFGGAVILAPSQVEGEDRMIAPLSAAALDGRPAVDSDLDGLGLLVKAVLARTVGPAGASALAEWLDQPRGAAAEHLTELEDRVFALAAPVAVRFGVDREEEAFPRRSDLVGDRSRGRPQPVAGELADWLVGWEARLGELAARVSPSLARWLASAVTALRQVRRSVWVVAAMGLASLVAMILLVQPSESSENVAQEAEPGAAATSPRLPDAANEGDPVRAAEVLLPLRERCIRDLSVLCLDSVHEPGSSAWEADAALLRSAGDGTGILDDPRQLRGRPVLVDRMGDLALLELGAESAAQNAAASVLLVRTEVGWRIRSLFDSRGVG